MGPVLKADILVTIHLGFVAFVVVGQFLILAGWFLGWDWTRNFSFRVVHLLAIGFVAAEALAGLECPLTTWERDLRGGYLRDVEEASWIGRTANRILFHEADHFWFRLGHITFACLVLLTFVLAPPRLPLGGRADPRDRGAREGHNQESRDIPSRASMAP